ncbi:MAG: hypothetical protein L3J37_02600 [Rhodobacteraceae bacterium]|nr:hypothetical protein [Paracoccaceae bacterium]
MKKLILATALTLSATAGFADSHGNKYVMSAPLNGQVFIMAQDHMSLYTFANDEAGVSNCYGECATNWPPAILPADTDMPESYTLIERSDGQMQIAYKGQPLYLFIGDSAVGDINGDGRGGVWALARPE